MEINGVIVKELEKFDDMRGWLLEYYRQDEVKKENYAVMSYISLTKPGMARGPHEHKEQSDYFCFLGTSVFKIYLWDNRINSPTYRKKVTLTAEKDKPLVVIIPPHVVHAYKNAGKDAGLAINCPNRLFRGMGKNQAVDEIRYEDVRDCPFVLDD
ncbi:MAG: dTDP-4-dehydrorhamnose 3,5-epimerase family protein [Candidatus Omnitrophica bacterium]|nr:dTDP-4-dehydrorhamnose 3,5-epimerase family protein [Candidatus Omnitrophota bacterium]MBU1925705.1 dTDP-4-dehydrorhamnose 3,5-epimerase family protein [Candidatus Omnitrophota bacterium]